MTENLEYSFSQQKSSILERILGGSLKVDNIEEIESILEVYPVEPLLYRKYADLLYEKHNPEKSITAYDQAAKLFIKNRMNLQAIVAKILQWSICKPSHTDGRKFHSLLQEEGARQTPLQRFWARMTYSELIAIMLRLVRTRFAAGESVLCPGDRVDHVYFIVSGMLSEGASNCNETCEPSLKTEPIVLGPNDVFGDIFPIDQQTTSRVEIRSILESELVKISKKALNSACRVHPQIVKHLKDLHKPDRRYDYERAWKTVRRTVRFALPAQVDITGHAVKEPERQWRHTGMTIDLSIGGMCIDLGVRVPVNGSGQIKGQLVQISLDLHDTATISLSGVVVWHRRQTRNKATNIIGIRFDPLTPGNRNLLCDYCSGNSSEQNLLWSLWDSMVKIETSD